MKIRTSQICSKLTTDTETVSTVKYLFEVINKNIKISANYLEVNNKNTSIVGKGGHNSPFLGQLPFSFLEIQDVPTFYRPIGKQKS